MSSRRTSLASSSWPGASSQEATADSDQLLTGYETQLTTAQEQANKASLAAAQYMQAHDLSLVQAQSDPTYQLLSAEASQAASVVAALQDDINVVKEQLALLSTGASGLYTVIDAPSVSNSPVSRTKTFLLAGGVGLAIGLIAAISYYVIVVRLDESMYSFADFPEDISYPVLIQIPQVRQRNVERDSRTKRPPPSGELVPKWAHR